MYRLNTKQGSVPILANLIKAEVISGEAGQKNAVITLIYSKKESPKVSLIAKSMKGNKILPQVSLGHEDEGTQLEVKFFAPDDTIALKPTTWLITENIKQFLATVKSKEELFVRICRARLDGQKPAVILEITVPRHKIFLH